MRICGPVLPHHSGVPVRRQLGQSEKYSHGPSKPGSLPETAQGWSGTGSPVTSALRSLRNSRYTSNPHSIAAKSRCLIASQTRSRTSAMRACSARSCSRWLCVRFDADISCKRPPVELTEAACPSRDAETRRAGQANDSRESIGTGQTHATSAIRGLARLRNGVVEIDVQRNVGSRGRRISHPIRGSSGNGGRSGSIARLIGYQENGHEAGGEARMTSDVPEIVVTVSLRQCR